MNKLRVQIRTLPIRTNADTAVSVLYADSATGELVTSHQGSYNTDFYDPLDLLFVYPIENPDKSDWVIRRHKRLGTEDLVQGAVPTATRKYAFFKVWAASRKLSGIWQIPVDFILDYARQDGAIKEVDITIELGGFGVGASKLIIHPQELTVEERAAKAFQKLDPSGRITHLDRQITMFKMGFEEGREMQAATSQQVFTEPSNAQKQEQVWNALLALARDWGSDASKSREIQVSTVIHRVFVGATPLQSLVEHLANHMVFYPTEKPHLPTRQQIEAALIDLKKSAATTPVDQAGAIHRFLVENNHIQE